MELWKLKCQAPDELDFWPCHITLAKMLEQPEDKTTEQSEKEELKVK